MPLLLMIRAQFARLRRSERGNVMMLLGFSLLPLVTAAGVGIDYARAAKAQTKLNAIADAAALVAVSKTLMSQADSLAAYYALQMFDAQAQSVTAATGVVIDGRTATATTDNNGRRTASVTYTAHSTNLFAGVLGMASLAIGGTSQTTNATAPDIDFYMLLDVSASMALPTTSAGLSQVAGSNSQQCQFACHSTNATTGIKNGGGTGDLYSVAKSYNLPLRIDAEGSAVSQLTQQAQSTQSKNGATYRMAIYSFEGAGAFTTLQPLTANLTVASTATTNLAPPLYYSDNCRTQACTSADIGNADWDTASSDAFTRINAIMPAPGNGIGSAQPKAVMFIITDGMRDEFRPSGRPEVAFDTAKCTAIKSRGIQIAVLYTEYLVQSLANDQWSQTNVAPYINQIEPALQACASPGLYTKVTTNQDISSALNALFQNAVATARISQ